MKGFFLNSEQLETIYLHTAASTLCCVHRNWFIRTYRSLCNALKLALMHHALLLCIPIVYLHICLNAKYAI